MLWVVANLTLCLKEGRTTVVDLLKDFLIMSGLNRFSLLPDLSVMVVPYVTVTLPICVLNKIPIIITISCYPVQLNMPCRRCCQQGCHFPYFPISSLVSPVYLVLGRLPIGRVYKGVWPSFCIHVHDAGKYPL